MLRPERLGNDVLAAEPFTEVNQPAPMRTKRAELSGKPVAGFLHVGQTTLFLLFRFAGNRFDVIDHIRGLIRRCSTVGQNLLHTIENLLLLGRRQMRAVEDGVDKLGEFRLRGAELFLSGNGRGQIIGQFGNRGRLRLRALRGNRQIIRQ